MKLPSPSEHQICNSIIEALNYSGLGFFFRENSGMAFAEHNGRKRGIMLGLKGKSDILGIRKSDGKFVAIECKKPSTRKSVTVFQQQFLDQIREFKGISGVATSIEEAIEIVKAV